MQELQTKFIVSKRPKEFLKQGLMYCGAYSVKAILEAYGKVDKKNPEDYHLSLWRKISGLTSAYTWQKVLKNYGLNAEVGDAESLISTERINFLKELLFSDNSIMVRIGNGYLPSGKYSRILGLILGHWITVWGYDDQKQVFYVYDSAVAPALYDENIPTGNKQRTYQEMLRDWRGGLFPWPFWRFLYIKISSHNKE